MTARTTLLNLTKKEQPFPLDVEVRAQFSDWKNPKLGHFEKTQYGHVFVYRNAKGLTQRQCSPGYQPVNIVIESTNEPWSVYEDGHL